MPPPLPVRCCRSRSVPGHPHDLAAARTHHIIRICERQGVAVLADRALAQARAPVERGVARLKFWQIFRRSHISPNGRTIIAKAVLTLERQR